MDESNDSYLFSPREGAAVGVCTGVERERLTESQSGGHKHHRLGVRFLGLLLNYSRALDLPAPQFPPQRNGLDHSSHINPMGFGVVREGNA